MNLTALPQNWDEKYRAKVRSPEEAVRVVEPGQRVFVGSGAAVPLNLVRAMAERADALHDTELLHILTLGVDPTTEERFSQRIRHANFFIGANVRHAVAECRADYTPIFLSEIPGLFKSRAVPIDVALIQVSPPDQHGFSSYGVAVDIVKSATEAAHHVVAEINPNMPRTLGDSFIHLNDVDTIVLSDDPILELQPGELDEVSRQVGRFVASLVEDGATLQMGIGSIPDATLAYLDGKRDLGIHTEMFSDGLLPLIEAGVVTNARKTLHRKKIVTSFVMGTRKLYNFVDNNPMIEFRPSQYTNDPFLISRNDNMVAINSALEVDLTGQVCADSIGHRFYSGIGGQVDFIRGAARSRGGKPIIALPSTAKKGAISRIVVQLSDGAGVVTTRGDIHYVVTEYGIAYLHGKSIRQRAIALISIAHPKFRQGLLEGAKARGYLEGDQILVTNRKGAYPIDLEERVSILDGTEILLRPLKDTDEDHLKELFYAESDQSRYFRFLSHMRYMPRPFLQSLAHIDYDKGMALCAIDDRDPREVTPAVPGPGPQGAAVREKLLGVARYFRNQRTDMAEFAILVHDDWQGRGIGSLLMKKLVKVAKANGIRGFTADILSENRRMFELLEGLGIERTTRISAGVAHVEFLFDPADTEA